MFLTVGSHEPFDRLVRAVDGWAGRRARGSEVFAQITERAGYRPQHFPWVAELSPAAYRERMAAASLTVSHAGMGSVLTALDLGRPILLMPRHGRLCETRNDHQQDTAARLCGRPGIHVAADEAALEALLDRLADGAEAPEPIRPFAEDSLLAALRGFVHAAAG